MFDHLNRLPADPILGLMSLFREDLNPNKVDLGVGVYKDDHGLTPVLQSVQRAEQQILAEQVTKSYVGPAGSLEFIQSMTALLLGSANCIQEQRVAAVQTPGGCGALRVAAELIKVTRPDATIWVSDPTWGNHIPLLGDSGLRIQSYPYYDKTQSSLRFDEMAAQLKKIPAGDLVLLHGCCHNPTGADLNTDQWRIIADLAQERGFIPFVDVAYQGFGDDVEQDVFGLRLLVERLPEVIVAASCSKNFGLYRERVGLMAVISASATTTAAVLSHTLAIVRGIYSMPPDHGARVVAYILQNNDLKNLWLDELHTMRLRIQGLRDSFCDTMQDCIQTGRFDFVRQQKGMFSYLGLTEAEVLKLREDHSIYLLSSSRASIAGFSPNNMHYVCRAIAQL